MRLYYAITECGDTFVFLSLAHVLVAVSSHAFDSIPKFAFAGGLGELGLSPLSFGPFILIGDVCATC